MFLHLSLPCVWLRALSRQLRSLPTGLERVHWTNAPWNLFSVSFIFTRSYSQARVCMRVWMWVWVHTHVAPMALKWHWLGRVARGKKVIQNVYTMFEDLFSGSVMGHGRKKVKRGFYVVDIGLEVFTSPTHQRRVANRLWPWSRPKLADEAMPSLALYADREEAPMVFVKAFQSSLKFVFFSFFQSLLHPWLTSCS